MSLTAWILGFTYALGLVGLIIGFGCIIGIAGDINEIKERLDKLEDE